MKNRYKVISIIILIFSLILIGCTKQGTDKNNDFKVDDTKSDEEDNNDFKFTEDDITDDTIALVLNKYTDEQYNKFQKITSVKLDDTDEKLLIIPMTDDTNIEIWSVEFKDNDVVEKEMKEQFLGQKKNTAIEVYAIRAEGIPSYKIKVESALGKGEYLISYNGKNENNDVEPIISSLNNDNKEEIDNNTINDDAKIDLSSFITKGQYEIKYDGSDNISKELFIKGNGTSYQVVGVNGKGPFVKVYSNIDDEVVMTYSTELTEEEFKNVSSINYLDEKETLQETPLICDPIKVGTQWGNKEIVEVGKNLKIDGLTLEGNYIKTWEKIKDGDTETVSVYYYSEGLGCVEHRVLVNGEVVEWSKATEIIKE